MIARKTSSTDAHVRRLTNILTRVLKNDWFWLTLLLTTIFLLRLPHAPTPWLNSWDESVFFTVAQDWVHGGTPYKTAWELKGPLLFLALTPPILMFNNNIPAMHIYTTFYLLFEVILVYLITKRLIGSSVSLIAALTYGLFFTTSDFQGLSSSSELIMMLPLLLATYLFLGYAENKQHLFIRLFLCGVCSAAAILVKPVAVFSALIFPSTIIVKHTLSSNKSITAIIKDVFPFFAGGLSISGVVLIYFILQNATYDFYHGFYWFPAKYSALHTVAQGWQNLLEFLQKSFRNDLFVFFATIGLLLTTFKSKTKVQKKTALFIVGLIVFSLVGVFWGRNMYPHYFLQMSLPIALSIAFTASLAQITPENMRKICWALIILTIVVKVDSPLQIVNNYDTVRESAINSDMYQVAAYIHNKTAEDDRIFVMGGQPIIYFLADRRSPTKYFFWILSSWHPYRDLLETDSRVLADFTSNTPKYIIYKRESDEGHQTTVEQFMFDNYHSEATFGSYVAYRHVSNNTQKATERFIY